MYYCYPRRLTESRGRGGNLINALEGEASLTCIDTSDEAALDQLG